MPPPLNSGWYEAIRCWVPLVLSPCLSRCHCTLHGEAQLIGSKFMGYFGNILKMGQGAFLDHLLILCQQITLKDSCSLTVKTEAASACDFTAWAEALLCDVFALSSQLVSDPSQGPPAASLRVVVLKLLISGTQHKPSYPAKRAVPAYICPPFGTSGITGNRPGTTNPFPIDTCSCDCSLLPP